MESQRATLPLRAAEGPHAMDVLSHDAMMYRLPPDILGGIWSTDFAAAGLPSEEDIAAYCRRTGRVAIPDFDFYVAFNMFRLAAILHGIRGRSLRGTAANTDAQAASSGFERVAGLTWKQVETMSITATPVKSRGN
jgi:aminoglycoside phosphotransferase (APT) family kinase protein